MGGKAGRPARQPGSVFGYWLDVTGTSKRRAARDLGISYAAVCYLRAGTKNPGRELAIRIRDYTGGIVRVESWP